MRIYKRKGSLYWQCEYRDGNGRRVQRSTQRSSKKAAELVGLEWERIAVDPAYAATHTATLSDALNAFLDQCESERARGVMADATVSFYQVKVGHLARVFGPALPLRDVTSRTVRDFLTTRRAEGASEHTLSKEVTALRQSLALAKLDGRWKGDVDAVVPRVAARYAPRERTLTLCEARDLLLQLAGDRRAWVAFSLATGAERGAVERAQLVDVRLDEGLVRVRGTKREARDRVVPVVLDESRALLELALTHREGDDDTLFLPWGNANRDLRQACERAGIPPCSPNDLRRTFASWHVSAGISHDVLRRAMGHTSTAMLDRVYGRMAPEHLAELMRRQVLR